MFYIKFILMYCRKTNILQLKGGQKFKNPHRLYVDAMKILGYAGNLKVVLESQKDSAVPF